MSIEPLDIVFALVAIGLAAVAIKSMSKKKPAPTAKLTSARMEEALSVIQQSPDLYDLADKYDYKLTNGLTIRGQKVGAVAWYGRGLIEIDYGFITSADIKTIVSTLLHEIAHLELGHTTFSQPNENAAIDWQLAAMATIYGSSNG